MEVFFKKSTVYAYHVPELDAIKVGFGDNPQARMTHYCKNHNLSARISSIRSWSIPATSVASALESAVHKGLYNAGFSTVDYSSSNGRAVELFALEGRSYDDAILYVAELLDTLTGKLIGQLGSGRTEIERRKQSELWANQRRDHLVKEKRERDSAKVSEFIAEWEGGLDEFIQPWNNLLNECIKIRKGYKPPGVLHKIKYGDDLVPHYIKWRGYTALVTLLPSYFSACRKAREFRKKIIDKYGKDIPDKRKAYGFNLERPCAKRGWPHRNQMMTPRLWDLLYNVQGDFIRKGEDYLCIYTDQNWATKDSRWVNIEIGLSASDVFGIGSEVSLDLLNRDMSEMLSLLTLCAKESLPPEFSE